MVNVHLHNLLPFCDKIKDLQVYKTVKIVYINILHELCNTGIKGMFRLIYDLLKIFSVEIEHCDIKNTFFFF